MFVVVFGKAAVVFVSLAVGYLLSSRSFPSYSEVLESTISAKSLTESAEEIDEIEDADLPSVHAGAFEPCKLVRFLYDLYCSGLDTSLFKVLVVRTDLKMSSGEISSQ